MPPSNTSSDITILSGATRNYGIMIGNQIAKDLACSGNGPSVNDFDPPNQVAGDESGQCADL